MPSIVSQTTRTKCCRTASVLVLLFSAPGTYIFAQDYSAASNVPTQAIRNDVPTYQPGAVRQATHQEPSPVAFPTSSADKPLLLPPRPGDFSYEKSSGGSRTMGAIFSVTASLTIVVGLFMVVAWLMRRSLPRSTRRLPSEVIETLGRAPLSGRQQMHLLHFGNKLLLVSVSPTGVSTLAEITDAVEIDRLAALCGQADSPNPAKAIKQIFGQLAGDKARAAAITPRSALSTASRTSAFATEATDV
jgi:flagellar biogenesis protein FliO